MIERACLGLRFEARSLSIPAESDGTYGRPRVRAELMDEDVCICSKRLESRQVRCYFSERLNRDPRLTS